MSMSLLIFGTLGLFIVFLIVKSFVPSKKERDRRSAEKAKLSLLQKVAGYERYLDTKGIDWRKDMDRAILALAARENFVSAINFYMHKADLGLSESKKYVEKLCLENGVSTEMTLKLGHTSVLHE